MHSKLIETDLSAIIGKGGLVQGSLWEEDTLHFWVLNAIHLHQQTMKIEDVCNCCTTSDPACKWDIYCTLS